MNDADDVAGDRSALEADGYRFHRLARAGLTGDDTGRHGTEFKCLITLAGKSITTGSGASHQEAEDDALRRAQVLSPELARAWERVQTRGFACTIGLHDGHFSATISDPSGAMKARGRSGRRPDAVREALNEATRLFPDADVGWGP